jgi:hypothetical protein
VLLFRLDVPEYKEGNEMRCFVRVMFLAMGLMVCGCAEQTPKLDPEVAKERQAAYESRMTDGPARGAVNSKDR